MISDYIIDYWWRQWLELFAGLPWDRHISAYVAIAAIFWLIGFAFKALTQK